MESLEVVLNPLDWDGVSAITSVLMLLINLFLLISVIFAYRTIKEEVKNRDSSLLIWAMDEMSKIKPDMHVLKQAGTYGKGNLATAPEDYCVLWSSDELKAAHRVSITLQRLAYMAMSGLISDEHFSKMWGPTFISTWAKLKPYVHHLRVQNDEPMELDDGGYSRNDFERYALHCKALEK